MSRFWRWANRPALAPLDLAVILLVGGILDAILW